ncbi:hypothetical protein SAMN05216276_103581 [Streptosporangium subroseum]|uniref:Uncharacterized protein n=1 Tax=Streptosporangium subroseum TaxID=106412 RepID=A0A239LW15_9ACTN|nr:hypothetical protein SAMN05216276_103581 [Streptosporangium subroseum]
MTGERVQRKHRHEMSGAAAHRGLAEAPHACRATVVTSGYGTAGAPVGSHRHRGHGVDVTFAENEPYFGCCGPKLHENPRYQLLFLV